MPTWIVTFDGRCECASPDCKHPGKHARTEHALLDATTDEAAIRSWWTIWPQAGVGIDLNRARLVSIAPDSVAWLTTFRGPGYGLPRTPSFASGGGAGHEHHLYRRPEACPGRRICHSGQYDILADGLAVLPPSPGRHWLVRPDQAPLAVVPLWAVDRLRAAEQRQEQAKHTARQAAVDAEGEPPVRLSGDALARWRGELFKTGGQGPGGVNRSDSLFLIALGLARGNASYRTILEAVRERDLTLGWGKYSARSDAEERYAEIAAKALGDLSPPTPPDLKNSGLADTGEHSPHCQPLHDRIRAFERQQSQLGLLWRKRGVKPSSKLVAAKVIDLQTSRESRGIEGPMPICIKAEAPPDSPGWVDDSLTAQLGGLDEATVSRGLDLLVEVGLYDKPKPENVVNKRGLSRPRLFLIPRRPAAEQLQTLLDAEPPAKQPAARETKRIRCAHHPLSDVANTKTETWTCTVCGRDARPARTTTKILHRIDQVPDLQVDGLVTGAAEPIPDDERCIRLPDLKNSGLVDDSPTVLLGDPEFSGLVTQQGEVEHACHDCGAFADASWGDVVEVNEGVWLHSGADAPCCLPMRVAS